MDILNVCRFNNENVSIKGYIIMKKNICLLVLLMMSVAMSAQSSGGQITRKKTNTKSKSSTIRKKNDIVSSRSIVNNSAKSRVNLNVINVYNEDQFFKALGSNRVLVIQKSLNLTAATENEMVLTNH